METEAILPRIGNEVSKLRYTESWSDKEKYQTMYELAALIAKEVEEDPQRLCDEAEGIALSELTETRGDPRVVSYVAKRRLELLHLRLARPGEYSRYRAAFPPATALKLEGGRFVVASFLDGPRSKVSDVH